MKMRYKLADGTAVPLFEADTDTAFKAGRGDRRGAIIGDPLHCIEAKALCRLPGVIEAYIGSGKDAYVIYKRSANRPFQHALHYTIPAASAKVRDAFETKKLGRAKTTVLWLRAPTEGRTLAARRRMDRARRIAVKNGAKRKKRDTPNKTRIHKLGVPHRPRAQIEAGVVTLSKAA